MNEEPFTYRGRIFTADDVNTMRTLIGENPTASRRELSLKICATFSWTQANGAPRDAICRGLMLTLHRAGRIELPAPRWTGQRARAGRAPSLSMEVDDSELKTTLAALGPLVIRQVRRTAEEALFNGLIEKHHYLGYVQPVGEHLKFVVYAATRPVACFSWTSAPRHLGPRDRFIGWSKEARGQNLRFVAYNSRFLILPWVQVPHLASHLLGRMARMLSGEWQRVYGHPLCFLETFIDPERFSGTCYKAANWVVLGQTTGRGKDDRLHRGPNRSIKNVLGYPLVRDFGKRLSLCA